MPAKPNPKVSKTKALEKIDLKKKVGEHNSVSLYRKLARTNIGKISPDLKRDLRNTANHVILQKRVYEKLKTLNKSEISDGLYVIDKIYDKIFTTIDPKNLEKYERIAISLAKDINRKEGAEVYAILQKYSKSI